jgi:capping protein beta
MATQGGDADIMRTALMLMRRMDPASLEDNAEALSALLDEEVADEFMQRVDLPLKVVKDTVVGKDFLASEFNADGDAYR